MVKLQVGLLGPCIFDGLELRAVLTSLLCGIHELAQRLKGGICAA
jgi:hypothetical protein